MNESAGKFLVITGVIIIITGLIFIYKDTIPFMRQLGRLPGDISIRREGFSFYFPVVTCIVISVLASLILYLWNRFK